MTSSKDVLGHASPKHAGKPRPAMGGDYRHLGRMFGLRFKQATRRAPAQYFSSNINVRVFLVGQLHKPLNVGTGEVALARLVPNR